MQFRRRATRSSVPRRRMKLRCEVLEARLLLAAGYEHDQSSTMGPLPRQPITLAGGLAEVAAELYHRVGPLLPEEAELAGLHAAQRTAVDSAKLDTDELRLSVIDRQGRATPRIVMPHQDTDSLIAAALEKQQARGVFSFATGIPIAINTDVHGVWDQPTDGMRRWSVEIASKEARSINFGFDQYVMPQGGQLVITGQDGTQHRFTDADNEDHGQLWTPIVIGQAVTLEVTVPLQHQSELQLRIGKVNHGFRDHQGGSKIGGNTSGACNIDVVCDADTLPGIGESIDQYRDQIRSVGAYTVGGVDTCSGALVNNTAGDGKPYFLTANHCGLGTGNAPSMVVYWNFECATCRQPGSAESGGLGNGPLDQFNSGAIFRAANATSDFALVELDDPIDPEVNAFYAGWDRSGNDATTAVGIHHPAVAEKRISFEFDGTTTTSAFDNAVPGSGTHYRVVDWDAGTTEGGSSGSPLFNQDGRIIGQLEGGFAACGNDASDWYGKVSVSWNGGGTSATRLSDWLDPTGSGAITVDGLSSGDDFGDAPDIPYGTLAASNGPQHTITGPRLGTVVNPEPDGTPTADASGDSGDDGIRFINPPVVGTTANLQVTSSPGGGELDFFFDFDGVDGFGNQPSEVFSATLSGGTETIPVAIPAGALTGPTFARFRISSGGGLGPLGAADSGEVEDYRFTIFATAPSLDFGDAPDGTYATLLANDGPRHAVSGPKLGATVDAEADGQPDATATGDGIDDDGVIFRAPLVRGQSVDVSVLSGGGRLDYFFDFDQDGSFGNSANEVFSTSLSGGEEIVTVAVPADAALGTTRARFRISSSGDLPPTGFAFDGEVEDYQVLIIAPNVTDVEDFDSRTPPALPLGWQSSSSGSTTWVTQGGAASDAGPNHAFVPNLGTTSDLHLTSSSITIPNNPSARLSFRNHFDTESTYDGGVLEVSIDGGQLQDITTVGSFISGGYTAQIDDCCGNPLANRQAWSGDSGGYIDTVIALGPSLLGKDVQFRWRMGTDSSISATGWRIDSIELSSDAFDLDYGDAPDPSFPTLLSSDGARHVVGSLSLGASVDVDAVGQQSALADGDDNDGQDDEDGVVLPTQLFAGENTLMVTASSDALLNAWIDINGDGSFAGEQVIKDEPLASGTHPVTVNLPPIGSPVTANARFRLSTQSALWFDGAAGDGEVEDYQIVVVPPRVDEVILNDGDPQRSSLKTVTVKFDSLVTIDSAGGDPFQFTQIGSPDNIVDTPTVSVDGGRTVVDFVFATGGPHVGPGGTLEDGSYQLLIDSSLISASGLALDGDEDGSPGGNHVFTDTFFRKFGDHNGNDLVELLDFANFRRTFDKSAGETGYLDGFDSDADSTIGLLDFTAFRRQFGT